MKKITARSLRWIFLAIIIVLVAAGASGFYFVYSKLSQYNQETIAKNTEANGTDKTIGSIESAIAYINENKSDIDKSKDITADTTNYQYQDQIIKDIRRIASSSHLVVDSISFASGGEGSGAAAGAAAPTTATPGAATPSDGAAAGAGNTTPAATGVTKQTATVTFSPQANTKLYYQYILDFLYKIQQNSTKFYTADLSLTSSDKNSETVDLETLTIDVYVKENAS